MHRHILTHTHTAHTPTPPYSPILTLKVADFRGLAWGAVEEPVGGVGGAGAER